LQNQANNPETDHLRNQMGPVDTERLSDLFDLSSAIRSRKEY
jgi:hypothetical protein